jgi:hypothetical protein
MKIKFASVSGLLALCLLLACHPPKSKIEGTYANYLADEYGPSWDTLIITPITGAKEAYQIENRTTYRQIIDGSLQAKKCKLRIWTAECNEKTGALIPSPNYPSLRTAPGGILLGHTAYRKLP